MKRKAIIFPYNAECASLVRNRELLLNHEIVACVSPIGYGLQGKDDKPIIIFDEATSNTDAYSEQQINGLLDTRLKDKTVIVITHKKEILSKVDQIVVLKEGVVADLGRYDDLIGKSDELNVMLEKAE